jgi:hypothetical protein
MISVGNSKLKIEGLRGLDLNFAGHKARFEKRD